MSMDDKEAFEGFIAELEEVSKKYGVVIQSVGGVEIYGEPLGEVIYSRNAAFGDLMPIEVARTGQVHLFTADHCLDSADMDYTDKLLILKPENLSVKYRLPDYQLVLAQRGFGCSPTARGRFLQGVFLKDGETVNFNRKDFLGVIKSEYIPAWAREMLPAGAQNVDQEQGGLSMT